MTDPRDGVLVVGPSWVGDMVMAQSLLRFLKSRDSDAAIDVLAPGWSLPIVARMPEVRRGIALDTAHGELGIGKRRWLARSLRGSYRRAIVLPRSLKAALVPAFAGIPVRTGFRGESRYWLINDVRPFDRGVLDQTVKRFLALGLDRGESLPASLPEPRLEVDRQRQEQLKQQLGLDTARPVIAMMPGAEYGPAKCWPLEYFASLALELGGRGYSVWVLGSAKDEAAGAAIAAASDAHNLCGKTALADAVDLLALASQAVSNDSGLMHIASAVGSFVHGIYGSSSPAFTPPLTARREIHYLALDCSPCFARECPLEHLNCLREITPSAVLKSIENAQK
ncbi:MAG: lipopolysaccharide heptosyltransferase II [Pseudomonadota bacterium]